MRNDLDGFVPEVQTARPKGGRRLSPELLEAKIAVRVAELRTDAALTSLVYATERLWRDWPPRQC